MEKELRKLGEAELEIMMVIWHDNYPQSAGSILEKMRGKRNWVLSTLMTALARLCDKGYVYCDRTTRTNLYSAVVTEKEYKRREGRNFLAKLYGNSLERFVASLYDGNEVSLDDIAELKALLNDLEKGTKK
jgi:BlaI family penicillinase repressor